jgi:hypothetical protein
MPGNIKFPTIFTTHAQTILKKSKIFCRQEKNDCCVITMSVAEPHNFDAVSVKRDKK